MSDQSSGRLITSVERAADVLLLFTRVESPDLGVTEIASTLDLSKSVVHRILTTLTSKSLIESNESTRRYSLGPLALSLGVSYLDKIDLRALVVPVLKRLSERTNETATLSLRYGWERMYVDQVTPNREVKMTVRLGRPFPLHTGSSSKAFLAFLPVDDQERYLGRSPLEAFTERTITDSDRLRDELAKIRERGYAVSYGERQAGAASIAGPVLDHRGLPAAVISLCGPLERFGDEVPTISQDLLEGTRELSRQLGHV